MTAENCYIIYRANHHTGNHQ